MVQRMEKTVGYKIRTYQTPMEERPDQSDVVLRTQKSQYQDHGPEWAGEGFWVTRGSRPEASNAVTRISRRLTHRSAEEDKMTLHVFGYFKAYPDLGLVFTIRLEDVHRGSLMLKHWADSDLAGDTDTTRSCSGRVCVVTGKKSWAVIDWGARMQPATAPHTPDAEVRALADLIVRSAAMLHTMHRTLWRRRLLDKLLTDNAAALASARVGYSRKLAYMRRTQKVSLGLLADYVAS